LYRERPLTT